MSYLWSSTYLSLFKYLRTSLTPQPRHTHIYDLGSGTTQLHSFMLLLSSKTSSCPAQPTFLTLSRPCSSSSMLLLAFYPFFPFLLLSLVPKDLLLVGLIPVCPALSTPNLGWCSVFLPCGWSQIFPRLLWEDLREYSRYVNDPLFQKFWCLSVIS